VPCCILTKEVSITRSAKNVNRIGNTACIIFNFK
jgi:hypothetical protein